MLCRSFLIAVLLGAPLALAGSPPPTSPITCSDCSPTTTIPPPTPTPTDCGKPRCGGECGDGILQSPPEECDLGAARNGQPNSGCTSDCKKCPVCGDGVKEGNEECDAGVNNGVYGSGCSTNCTLCGFCGDGVIDDGEECDNGWKLNGIPGGNCSSNCTIVNIGPTTPCSTTPITTITYNSTTTTPCTTTPVTYTTSSSPQTSPTPPAKPPSKDKSGGSCSCPTCNPIVGLNYCDTSTSCITTPSNNDYCACRAGYRADNLSPTDPQQFRLNFFGQGYRVFVKPGIGCNTLCTNWYLGPDSCQEVPIQGSC